MGLIHEAQVIRTQGQTLTPKKTKEQALGEGRVLLHAGLSKVFTKVEERETRYRSLVRNEKLVLH